MPYWPIKVAAKASKEYKWKMQQDTYCTKEMPSLALPISIIKNDILMYDLHIWK